MSQVAILHFTAEPCVGGVEHIVELQRAILRRHGHDVLLVTGEGGTGRGVVRVPAMLPPPGGVNDRVPEPRHPDVQALAQALGDVISGCDAVWVHNILTVYLHPALTVALLELKWRSEGQSWVAFCHDLTESSAYWPARPRAELRRLALPRRGVKYVVDTQSRQLRAARAAGVSAPDVACIPLPVDATAWLRLAPATARLARRLDLQLSDPLIVVPAKLLPHKNLTLAVHLTSALRRLGREPKTLITGAASPHQPAVSGSIRRELMQAADAEGVSDRVILLSSRAAPATREVVRDLIALADLVFLPSTEEGYGLPLLEALLLRTPVLCSDIPSFRGIADGYARFFDVNAPLEEIACLAGEITSSPAASRRREALWSMPAYERAILDLLPEAPEPSLAADS